MSPCPRCVSADSLAVTLEPHGQPMRLQVCRACEHRWWTQVIPGDIVLEDVLTAVAGT